MTSHSHVTRLQMMERGKRGGKYIPVSGSQAPSSIISGTSNDFSHNQSVLSGNSSKTNPKNLKLYSQRPKSQENLYSESVLSDTSSKYPSSFRSIKSGGGGMGVRSHSKMSLASMSRSMGASKASLASQKSTIQQEYHDIKVQRKINAPWFGSARKPFQISIILYILAFIFLVIGLTILFLRGFGNIFLSHDIGEILGPLFIVFCILCVSVGIRFSLEAYKLSSKERLKIRFRGDDYNKVEITKKAVRKPNEKFVTGTKTNQAISRQLMTTSMSELQIV